ncbi:hypothetical protein Tco_1020029 [Tanacetum coccineum]|uniref:Nucleoplasmin-like domain-containing protein n=1 Tax=Tanacetum coccineum TaxID=301880 RepID=A0ABQ5FZ99_9ASTR
MNLFLLSLVEDGEEEENHQNSLVKSIKLYVRELDGESSMFMAFRATSSGKTYTIQADTSDTSSFPSILLCNKIDISNVALNIGCGEGFGAEGDEYYSDAQEEVKEEEATRKKEVTPPVSNGFDLTS